jgi:cytochrome c peroxidase
VDIPGFVWGRREEVTMGRWILLFVAAAVVTCGVDARAGKARREPIQPIPPAEVSDADKVELGKMLFFEPRLSGSGFISCNSCHNLATGGVDCLPTSIGHKWQLGPINSPTVLNARYNFVQFWDGRAADLREQAGGPIENPAEMASSHGLAIEVLKSMPEYVQMFKEVYGSDDVTIDQVTDAIAKFEETLVTPGSRFDQWLEGNDSVLSPIEEEGYALFQSKGCIACHNGVGVGGTSFQKFGAVKPYEKDTKTLGRYNVTKREADKYFFKVPILRNVALTAPYFHDGSVWDLSEAVDVMAEYQVGMTLSDDEKAKITGFLETLTGEQPNITYPVLPASTPATPRPERG